MSSKKQLLRDFELISNLADRRERVINELRGELQYKEASYSNWISSLKAQIAALEMAVEIYKDTIEILRGVNKIYDNKETIDR